MAQAMNTLNRTLVVRSRPQRSAISPTSRCLTAGRSSVTSRRMRNILTSAEGEKGAVEEAAKDLKEGATSAVDEAEKAFRESANKANKATSQAGVVEGTVRKPLAEGKPATDPNNAWDESIKEAGKNETEALGTKISIPDALRFRGVGPEHINSRLAMIGVTTGYLTKLITGKNTLDQYQAAPLPVILTFILFITASLIPITKGVTPEKAQQGIWTTKAEIYNGRLAMLGFISLIATDGWQWFSALQAAKGAGLAQ